MPWLKNPTTTTRPPWNKRTRPIGNCSQKYQIKRVEEIERELLKVLFKDTQQEGKARSGTNLSTPRAKEACTSVSRSKRWLWMRDCKLRSNVTISSISTSTRRKTCKTSPNRWLTSGTARARCSWGSTTLFRPRRLLRCPGFRCKTTPLRLCKEGPLDSLNRKTRLRLNLFLLTG